MSYLILIVGEDAIHVTVSFFAVPLRQTTADAHAIALVLFYQFPANVPSLKFVEF
jgi:hypothetical protein